MALPPAAVARERPVERAPDLAADESSVVASLKNATAGRISGEEAAREVISTALRRLGTPAEAVESPPLVVPPASGAELFGVPVGDLDGDGGDDLIGFAPYLPGAELPPRVAGQTLRNLTVVSGVRGRDGAILWTRVETADAVAAIPATVGPSGMRGSYLVAYRRIGAVVEAWELQVTAVGPAGETVWTRTFTGLLAWGPATSITVGRSLPFVAGALEADGRPGTDLLLQEVDVVSGAVWIQGGRASVVSGADGSSSAGGDVPGPVETLALPGPDLDADGADDYLLLGRGDGLRRSALHARSGRSGEPLWTADVDVTCGCRDRVRPAGDVTGDGTSEILIWGWRFDERPPILPRVWLVDGASGRVLWRQVDVVGSDGTVREPFAMAWLPGDLNGDGRPEIGVLRALAPGDAQRVGVSALDGAGGTVSSREVDVSPERFIWAFAVGDANADGHEDIAFLVSGADWPEAVVVSGRTGRTLSRGGSGYPVVFGARWRFTASGDDLLLGDPQTLRAYDGRTGAKIWETASPVGRTIGDEAVPEALRAQPADLDGDGRTDILTRGSPGNPVRTLPLRGSDGLPMWDAGVA